MTESHKYTEPVNALDDAIVPAENTTPEPNEGAEETPKGKPRVELLHGTDLEGNIIKDVLDDDLSWR